MSDASPYPLRLSHAASWVLCPAFVRVQRTEEAQIVEQAADNTVREEGTAMHWVAEQYLLGRECSYVNFPLPSHAPNGVELTEELIEAAQFYIDTLETDYQLVPFRVEEQLQARRIHPTACGGKPDAYGHDLFRPRIIVPDLKGGYRHVNVFPNWQLIGYLAAILDNNPEWEQPDTEVEFVIVQPRAYHREGPVRKQVVTLRDLYPYFDSLRMAASLAMDPNAHAVAGPQCDDCAGRASCTVAQNAGARAVEVSGDPDIHDLPIAALDYEMMRLEEAERAIKARLTGLQAQALHHIRRGAILEHYALGSGRGKLVWTDDAAEAAALAMGDLMGSDLRKPQALITPTQAMKQLPRELLEQYTHRRSGETKLVRFDRHAAVKAFSGLAINKDETK